MKKQNKKNNNDGYVVLYHKSPTDIVKMTKRSSLKASQNSAVRFERIGIAPCSVVKISSLNNKKPKTKQ